MMMDTPEKRHEKIKLAQDGIKEFRENFEIYRNAPAAPELAETDKAAYAAHDEYMKLLEKVADLADQGTPEANKQVHELMDGRLWELGQVMQKMTGACRGRRK
ncbi:hypothetical protein B9G69_001405 [Bdellovibrio sp. SKB1291214]|uniref:hypothetical protein n=1 Tax=Bdellovibrio sp. SKB1291214 TaxID=1732569 RepID=UPI00223EEE14|nr:hypothetical protein [Bdellovibrio sp. SKB1291214]UYL09232.1 hypothetical protein B9G69_001405 [Bdellovibrio sp. SKB1291214]